MDTIIIGITIGLAMLGSIAVLRWVGVFGSRTDDEYDGD